MWNIHRIMGPKNIIQTNCIECTKNIILCITQFDRKITINRKTRYKNILYKNNANGLTYLSMHLPYGKNLILDSHWFVCASHLKSM